MRVVVQERPLLFQYWHQTPPAEIEELMDTWQSAAGDRFEYLRFNDQSAKDFIREHYDQRTEMAYLACGVPAMRADLFRICALLVRPGIYVDADMRSTGHGVRQAFLRDKAADLFSLYTMTSRGILFRRGDRIANGFIVVKNANDALIGESLKKALYNIENRISNNVYLVTGPGIVTRLLKQSGPLHNFFQGFEFWTEEDLAPYMRMVGSLHYKKTTDHWVNAQNTKSIFLP